MTLEARYKDRTLEEIRKTLESIAEDCVGQLRDAKGQNAELLRDVVRRVQEARERVLDVSVGIDRYITHCMEEDDKQRGLEVG